MKNLTVHFDKKTGLLLIRNNQRQTVATVNTNQSEKQALDLAYLFAAAPDMWDAIANSLGALKELRLMGCHSEHQDIAIQHCEAALAKARGV